MRMSRGSWGGVRRGELQTQSVGFGVVGRE